MMVDWDLIFIVGMITAFFVGLYFVYVKSGPGCSGNCQQGRRPCDCNLNKKGQV
jgi:hypothetical protein